MLRALSNGVVRRAGRNIGQGRSPITGRTTANRVNRTAGNSVG